MIRLLKYFLAGAAATITVELLILKIYIQKRNPGNTDWKTGIEGLAFGLVPKPNAQENSSNNRRETSSADTERKTELLGCCKENLTMKPDQLSSLGNVHGRPKAMKITERTLVSKELYPSISTCRHKLDITWIPPSLWIDHNSTSSDGYKLPMFSCDINGRLGMTMGRYASLFTIQKIFNVTVVIPPALKIKLSLVFPNITLPMYQGNMRSGWQHVTNSKSERYNYCKVRAAAAGLLGPYQFLVKGNLFELPMIHKYREEVLKEFSFSSELQSKAKEYLNEIRTRRNISDGRSPLVAFHIRRTDYISLMKKRKRKMAGMQYYEDVLRHFRQKLLAPVFVVSSDDTSYVKRTFAQEEDVDIIEGMSPGETLAILSTCDYNAFTIGSFGFWGAYLNRNAKETIYYDTTAKEDYKFSSSYYEGAGITHFKTLSS